MYAHLRFQRGFKTLRLSEVVPDIDAWEWRQYMLALSTLSISDDTAEAEGPRALN